MNPDDEKIIVFMTFDNPFEANLIKTKLESEGIECFLSDENVDLYGKADKGINLHIFEKDLIKAQGLLKQNNELD